MFQKQQRSLKPHWLFRALENVCIKSEHVDDYPGKQHPPVLNAGCSKCNGVLSTPVDLPSGMRCFLDYQDFFHNANALTSPFCKFIALLSPDRDTG